MKNRNPDFVTIRYTMKLCYYCVTISNSEKIQELSGKENREIKEYPYKVQVRGAESYFSTCTLPSKKVHVLFKINLK